MDDLNLVKRYLSQTNKSETLTELMLRFNAAERNNFTRVPANARKNWLRAWLAKKDPNVNLSSVVNAPDTFVRYLNSLNSKKNTDMNLRRVLTPKKPPPFAELKIPNKGYIQLEPLCKNNHNKGVYIYYGFTEPPYRGTEERIGYRLRKAAVNAARNSKIPLYQVSQDIEGLVAPGKLPVSGKIMESLGAIQLPHAPPCRSKNKRGLHNYAFVVGEPFPEYKRSSRLF